MSAMELFGKLKSEGAVTLQSIQAKVLHNKDESYPERWERLQLLRELHRRLFGTAFGDNAYQGEIRVVDPVDMNKFGNYEENRENVRSVTWDTHVPDKKREDWQDGDWVTVDGHLGIVQADGLVETFHAVPEKIGGSGVTSIGVHQNGELELRTGDAAFDMSAEGTGKQVLSVSRRVEGDRFKLALIPTPRHWLFPAGCSMRRKDFELWAKHAETDPWETKRRFEAICSGSPVSSLLSRAYLKSDWRTPIGTLAVLATMVAAARRRRA